MAGRAWWVVVLGLLAVVAVAHDAERLPVGDGHVSSEPRVGYVYLCQTRFNGLGAFRDGPWLRGGYWYPGEKLQVQGNVAWPDARFTIAEEGGRRVIRGNGLPDHGTVFFPSSRRTRSTSTTSIPIASRPSRLSSPCP